MRSVGAALLAIACLAQAGPLRAESANKLDCESAIGVAQADYALPHVAAAAEGGEIKIVVVGSASSALSARGGPDAAYPGRLREALANRLPKTSVKVAVEAHPKRTAAGMAEDFERILKSERPVLVVWQTGTVDAMRGVDPEEFRATLVEGVEQARQAGADIILMNMQYSPRTESLISGDVYLENMRVVSIQEQVPLFDRFAIMKQWSELGLFDFTAATRDIGQAMRVHECLGRLLAGVIAEALQAPPPAPGAKDTN